MIVTAVAVVEEIETVEAVAEEIETVVVEIDAEMEKDHQTEEMIVVVEEEVIIDQTVVVIAHEEAVTNEAIVEVITKVVIENLPDMKEETLTDHQEVLTILEVQETVRFLEKEDAEARFLAYYFLKM